MKFKLFFYAAIAFVLGSCTSNEIIDSGENALDVKTEQPVLHITASFEESVETRAILEEVGTTLLKPILYKWETTDRIQFSFVQDGLPNPITAEANVTSVSLDGKTAQFTVPIPGEIDQTAEYKLYAFRSDRKSSITSGSALNTNSTIAVLPIQQYNYLATLADQATVFSIWSEKIVPADNSSNIALSFRHLGSMITLNLKNVGNTAITDLHSLLLQAVPNTNWIYNRYFGDGGAQFDLATGQFVIGQEQFSYTLTFFPPSSDIAGQNVGTYYLWFIPKSDAGPITLRLVSLKSPGANVSTDATGETTVSRSITQSLVPGKNYVLFAHINGDSSPYTIDFKTSVDFD